MRKVKEAIDELQNASRRVEIKRPTTAADPWNTGEPPRDGTITCLGRYNGFDAPMVIRWYDEDEWWRYNECGCTWRELNELPDEWALINIPE